MSPLMCMLYGVLWCGCCNGVLLEIPSFHFRIKILAHIKWENLLLFFEMQISSFNQSCSLSWIFLFFNKYPVVMALGTLCKSLNLKSAFCDLIFVVSCVEIRFRNKHIFTMIMNRYNRHEYDYFKLLLWKAVLRS